jgi:hypothetical protein
MINSYKAVAGGRGEKISVTSMCRMDDNIKKIRCNIVN